MRPSSNLRWQVDDGNNDDEIDQRILHERDHRRRAQAGRVRVCGEQCERDEQRQVLREEATRTAEPDHLKYSLDTHELECDIRHGRQNASDRNCQRQSLRTVTTASQNLPR